MNTDTVQFLTIAVQNLSFNSPNIIVAVKYKKDIKDVLMMTRNIINDLGYDEIIIGENKIKIKEFQSYIMFESVFDKYKDSDFLTFSIMDNEVIT